MKLPQIPQWAWDAGVMLVAVVHLALVIDMDNQPVAGFAIAGVAALLLRRRYPFLVFLVTLPAAFLVFEKVASMIALYTLTSTARRPWKPIAATAMLAVCFVFQGMQLHYLFLGEWRAPFDEAVAYLPEFVSPLGHFLRASLYYVAMAAVPTLFGYSRLTRRRLAGRLVEIGEAREHEQRLLTQQALAAERAQLAREMHDVVSHQVSLIAVQAGALELQAPDARTRTTAEAIREVSVTTLEELRQMVRVLHASGRRREEPVPQPSIAQLERLVEGSGIDARLEIGPLPELDPPAQRAVYRTVQEALTNVRKHAPGATTSVRLAAAGRSVVVEVANTRATRPVVELPSSGVGLLGLRQRAELLDGEIEYGPDGDGGWRLRLTLPPAGG
ncbi:sensor histidine kinase [Glycomyces albidus]|uniref:histidine kinase n=1 Tax=Glycomyces albidus TaxID=2656774 RepID=A0A6L5G4D5_9ACTN|nr:histidine kinase [Glycomyces albidus]MQM24506.1 two-component sensor histidine kinase [Glycomyces albidus]